MVQVVCHGEKAFAHCLAYEKELIAGCIDALTEHCVVGLILVNVAQLGTQQPRCRREPAEHYYGVAQSYIYRMMVAHVCLLVYHYLPGSRQVVFQTDYYAVEPAERCRVATDYGHQRAAGLAQSSATEKHHKTHQRHNRPHQQQHETGNPHQREHLYERKPRPIAVRHGGSLYECRLGKGDGMMDGSRRLQRDVQKRQQESGRLHREQHTAVEGVKALTAEQQFVRQIENGLKHCHLYYIYEEHSHIYFVFRLVFPVCPVRHMAAAEAQCSVPTKAHCYLSFTMSMSFLRSSTVRSSSLTSDDTASRYELPKNLRMTFFSDPRLYSSRLTVAKYWKQRADNAL